MTTHNNLSEHYDELIAGLGGPENATDLQKKRCRVATDLFQQLDAITTEFRANGDLEVAKLVAVINQLCDELDHLGINDPSDFCRDRVH